MISLQIVNIFTLFKVCVSGLNDLLIVGWHLVTLDCKGDRGIDDKIRKFDRVYRFESRSPPCEQKHILNQCFPTGGPWFCHAIHDQNMPAYVCL